MEGVEIGGWVTEMVRYVICPDEDIMELVVIEKHAYLQLKLQIESLSAQIESVKKKIGPVEMEK